MEGFEYDVYEYFGELEYGSDSYWDARMKHLESAGLGEKRKSAQEGEDTEARMVKKRRKDGGRGEVPEVGDNVLYVPFERRLAPLPPGIEQQGGEGRFALLPDWKERFPERGSPVGKRKPMPAEMRRAAEEVVGEDEEDEEMSGDREDGDEMELGEDGEHEEDDEGEDEENDDDEEESTAGLDQDLVMQVLRQKLADSGLGDVDKSMFKDVIAKMMSGDGDSEDAVGGLASLLLGQEGGGGKAFEGFLAGQGVKLGGAEGDDDEEEEGESKDDDTEIDPRPTKKAKANPTRKRSQNPLSTASSSTAKPKPTTKTPSKSRTTRPNLSTFQQSPSPNRTSPIVVPSPPPPATAVAAPSTRSSRKRRAPSLDEPALPAPAQVATASSSAKPPAKRRRATPTSSRSETPADDSGTATTRRRTTRSAAAGAKKGGS
jgi:hypothetical protein